MAVVLSCSRRRGGGGCRRPSHTIYSDPGALYPSKGLGQNPELDLAEEPAAT